MTDEIGKLIPGRGSFIAGEFTDGGSGGAFEHVNPATGEPQALVHMGGAEEIDRAVEAAGRAHSGWRALPPSRRRDVLMDIAAALLLESEDLARLATMENGTPIRSTRASVSGLAREYFAYYAGWADKIEGRVVPIFPGRVFDYYVEEPYGVVGAIIPWNGPLGSIGQKVAPALAAGNCVVLKPPELAPFTSLRFAKLCVEAGLPPGVLNVVPGGAEAGEALTGQNGVRKISFTGGPAAAQRVLQSAAKNLTPVALELGGKSANIVFSDADLDAATAMAVQMGVVALSGQGCLLPTRLLVEQAVYDTVVEGVVTLARGIAVGEPLDEETMMGPLISENSCERVSRIIADAEEGRWGELVCGGRRLAGELSRGFYIQPTIFTDVDNRSPLAQEEIFGPVLSVMPFKDEEEAIRLANDTRYGLGAFLHTSNLNRAHRVASQLEAGYVGINGFPMVPPGAPFGGIKQSGDAREGGYEGLKEFLWTKNVYTALR